MNERIEAQRIPHLSQTEIGEWVNWRLGEFAKSPTRTLHNSRFGQELAPNRDRWLSRGCRGVAGPVPQPLWIKDRIQLSRGL